MGSIELEPVDIRDKLVFDPDCLCHVCGDDDTILCGAPSTGEVCGDYGGEAVCPACGRPTCPTCALLDQMDHELDRMLEGGT